MLVEAIAKALQFEEREVEFSNRILKKPLAREVLLRPFLENEIYLRMIRNEIRDLLWRLEFK